MAALAQDTIDYKPTEKSELEVYRERLKWIKLKVSDKCEYYLDLPERTTDVKDAEVYGFELLQCIDTRNLPKHDKTGKHLIATFDDHYRRNHFLVSLGKDNILKFIALDGTTIVASTERFDKKEDIALVDIFPDGYINVDLSDGLACFYRHHSVDKLIVLSLSAKIPKPTNEFGLNIDKRTYPEDERPVSLWVYSYGPMNYRELENRKDLTFGGLNYWVNYTGKYSENEAHYPIIDGELAALLHGEMMRQLIDRNSRPSILQRVTGDELPF